MAGNWNNFVVILRNANLQEYAVLRADYYGWGAGYDGNPNLLVGGYPENWEGWNWDEWRVAMNGAKVSLYITNCNNGTADVQAVIKGSDGNTYKLYYLSIGAVETVVIWFFKLINCGVGTGLPTPCYPPEYEESICQTLRSVAGCHDGGVMR